MSSTLSPFNSLDDIAVHLRYVLENGIHLKENNFKKIHNIVLFAYNGTGKTRLSMSFKDQGKANGTPDTLYYNAFTEDLFYWNNDLENDVYRVLKLNDESRFFDGMKELEMESRIEPLLNRYTDFSFYIDYEAWEVIFFRDKDQNDDPIPIKISRGEEQIFIWCFFLAIAQLAVDEQEAYNWVKYIYIDDPISSLDDNNAIAVASHLSQLLKSVKGKIKVIISSHHALFFNVIWNELNEKKTLQPYFLSKNNKEANYTLRYTNNTPFFHHVALLKELHEAAKRDQLYTYHFNILRSILEKTASFHGFSNFSACIKKDPQDEDGILYARLINVLSHGNYSIFEPREMLEENKQYFKKILYGFMENYRFNPEIFPDIVTETTV